MQQSSEASPIGRQVKAQWWKRSLTKWQIKVYLSIVGIIIVIGVLLYTQNIVDRLIESEKRTVSLYAEILQNFTKSNNIESLFLIDKVTPTITFPCIVCDATGTPLEPFDQYSINTDIDTTLSIQQQRTKLTALITEMKLGYQPIDIRDADGNILSKVYYTNSVLVKRLRILPYVEIIIVTVFIGIGYLAFNYLKRNEESHIWVGMAKEAAHQLGTPISSMLAWIELLRLNRDDEQSFNETAGEMEHDIERLRSIANRFSLIGSEPKLMRENVSSIIEQTCVYFERRFPHLGRNITLTRTTDNDVYANVNAELFGWVFENLIKNAAEAIEVKEGMIDIAFVPANRTNHIALTIRDNGKGMSPKVKKQIFNPGFTTKKRGWGLGLSLSRRIIEEYHKGKLIVQSSVPGEGTVFVIEIPADITTTTAS
ncbi:MAG: HAMP domain-containing histidine kinase [Candidatus Kapabacteria bacterium]|nr:HAMP domain-containing histidine kinase [Candidatus Kapabacteria bacterium]